MPVAAVTTRITVRNYPKVFVAFTDVLRDGGGINRIEPAPTYFDVPEPYLRLLKPAESQLSGLSVSELEDLTIGEESERATLVSSKGLQDADKLLNAFFERFYSGVW